MLAKFLRDSQQRKAEQSWKEGVKVLVREVRHLLGRRHLNASQIFSKLFDNGTTGCLHTAYLRLISILLLFIPSKKVEEGALPLWSLATIHILLIYSRYILGTLLIIREY